MKQPQFNWAIALLFLFAMLLASGRLVMTGWTQGLTLAQAAAMLGTILGLLLGISQLKPPTRRWMTVAYSALILPWLLLNMTSGQESLQIRLLSLFGRIWQSAAQLINAEEINDPLLFVAFASLLFWLTGIFCGQAILQTGRLLSGLLAPSLLIFFIQIVDAYPPSRIWIVAAYLIIVLLLIGRKNYLENNQQWQAKGIFTGPEPEYDLNRSIILGTLVIVFLAWSLPTPAKALPAAARWWRENSTSFKETQDRLAKALAALNSEQPPPIERYGESLSLGNQAAQGEGLLFRVRPPLDASLPRYYWRARVYDRYQDGTWSNASLDSRSFLPEGQPVKVAEDEGLLAEFEFEWFFTAQATLLAPPQPIWVSRPAQLLYSPTLDETTDPSGWRATPPLVRGERYIARSILKNPSIIELRNAGEDYPAWVQERYLTLPNNLSPRIIALALSLSEDAETPYDKAEQITNYLRENIVYSETVPWLPPGANALELFLFEWQRGYCNYSASAQVLMLRAVGVPSRLAVGYAQGERSNGRYIARDKDAHAWPEVYFPGIGWVEFEPTGNQSPLIRPSGIVNEPRPELAPILPERDSPQMVDESAPTPNPAPNIETRAVSKIPSQTIFAWIIITILIISSGYTLWYLHQQKSFQQRGIAIALAYYRWRGKPAPNWLANWQRWAMLSEVERAYHTINQALGWFKQAQSESLTPAERVHLLKKFLPQATAHIDALAAEHERTMYSNQPGNPTRAKKAAWKIRISLLRAVFD